MAEIGDIWRFDDVNQLLAYAEVLPREASSGKGGSNPKTGWHMTKTGNAHLWTAVYHMVLVGTQHNPVIAAHFQRKREAGKSKMNSLGHCMSKSLSLVWRKGQPFDPSHRT
jgi:transposase